MLNGDKETKYAQRVIKEYGVHEETDIDKLRKLDRKAKRPAEIFAYVYGTVSALVSGWGCVLPSGSSATSSRSESCSEQSASE